MAHDDQKSFRGSHNNKKEKGKKKSPIFVYSLLGLVMLVGATLVGSAFAPEGSFIWFIGDGLNRWTTQHIVEPFKKRGAESATDHAKTDQKDEHGAQTEHQNGANGDAATDGSKSYLLDGEDGTQATGGIVTFKDSNSMGSYIVPDGDPLNTGFPAGSTVDYAPAPDQSFRNAKCDLKADHAADPGSNNSWTIPAVGASAPYTITGQGSLKMSLPNAPAGTENADTARIGDTTGSILQLGHVNEPSGAVSPWGRLHQVDPCEHVYQRGTDGKVHEYVVTDLYTVAQTKFQDEKDLWRTKGNGPAKLYMVTCSGATVRDDGSNGYGGTLYFNYQRNLIMGAVPVS